MPKEKSVDKKKKKKILVSFIFLALISLFIYSLLPNILRLKYKISPEQEIIKFENLISKCERSVFEKNSVESLGKEELSISQAEYQDLVEKCVNSKNKSPKFRLDYDGSKDFNF